jgi:chlorophyllide a reductase subunit X
MNAFAPIEPAPPAPKETQIIAIYGKGGIGKSFTLANLSYMMAQQGKKVLLIGCDPKSDTTSLLFGGRACPTIIETSAKKKLAGEDIRIGDVCFKRDGVFAMELGGPEVGPGLRRAGHHPRLRAPGEARLPRVGLRLRAPRLPGGRGLRRLRPADRPGHVPEGDRGRLERPAVALRGEQRLLGGGVLPQARAGNVGVAGMVINKDDGTGEAQAFSAAAGIPVLAAIPADDDIRRKSANYEIIGRPESRWGELFAGLAEAVGLAPPLRPKPLDQDALLGLFAGEAVGRGVTLVPATIEDMCGPSHLARPSLEVVYDA